MLFALSFSICAAGSLIVKPRLLGFCVYDHDDHAIHSTQAPIGNAGDIPISIVTSTSFPIFHPRKFGMSPILCKDMSPSMKLFWNGNITI